MASLLATFSVLKDHVKLKVTQDTIAIDNMGNKNGDTCKDISSAKRKLKHFQLNICNFKLLFDRTIRLRIFVKFHIFMNEI